MGDSFSGRVCLVTGGAGFIGSHLVAALRALGNDVRVLDVKTGGDVRNGREVAEALRGVDVVFHLAAIHGAAFARDPDLAHDVNVNGTQTVFAAAAAEGVKRVVYASSAAVYGCRGLIQDEILEGVGLSEYGAHKQLNEEAAGEHWFGHGSFVGLRLFNVYGPGQAAESGAVIPRWMEALRKGQPVPIEGDGRQVRDFVHVKDVVRAFLMVAEADSSALIQGLFNVGSGIGTSLSDLLQLMCRVTGSGTVPVKQLPARRQAADRSQASIARIANRLGWLPQVTLGAGLRELAKVFGNPYTNKNQRL